jgi:ribosomal protein S12 methylthiotransferase accessory factor
VRKVYFTGTHRVRSPTATWAAIEPVLGRYGITRLADVTGLDVLGIPVVMSLRPLGQTLSVAQGKGLTPLLARVSAAMEAIELWYAERRCPAPDFVGVPAGRLRLPYEFDGLQRQSGCLVTSGTPLDWLTGVSLVTGDPVPVPRDCVELSRVPDGRWWAPRIKPSGNGLASGNSYGEATAHALYELLERDAIAAVSSVPADRRTVLALGSVVDRDCVELLERIDAAGVWVEVVVVGNQYRLPCFVAYLWNQTYALLGNGSGAHRDPAVALARALTEAAQSRLTAISGSREDLGVALYKPHLQAVTAAPAGAGTLVAWDAVLAATPPPVDDVDEEVRELANLILRQTRSEPVAVILESADFVVVKVVGAGLRLYGGHYTERPVVAG